MDQMHDTMKQCRRVEKSSSSSSSSSSCLESTSADAKRPKNCFDLLEKGDSGRGMRQVYPYFERQHESVWLYCDQATDGGGWTVFQRRGNLTTREDFRRTWLEYQLGFGNLTGEFWLGLKLLNTLTSSALQQLRVDLHDWDGEHRWAKYEVFKVGPAHDNYRLLADSHQQFSTYDADNDPFSGNCAARYKGGWWYYLGCYHTNPNGYPYQGHHDTRGDGITWSQWKGPYHSLRGTTFMFKPSF
ncbi:hypothetical protein Pmani_025498 [Petrolisthes manimaculis]|uniref:Fibrinogen C-terminal domain-containing protein n=1 Tax=Petrolisthes manimaculis TaxID=1843537 RepID=A0AAE1TXL6_9EUCA|nr:hypothetical protein Pmani_025498 [Petrolisthes manimaculis]